MVSFLIDGVGKDWIGRNVKITVLYLLSDESRLRVDVALDMS